MDKIPFCFGVGAVGTGIVAGVRRQAEQSSREVIILGGGLFLLATIIKALTIPSLTFFPILQLLFFGGVLLSAALPYLLLR